MCRLQQFFEDGARIEAAFRKYFHRADAKQTQDSYEILVCHANVIRYFVCRALQFPPEAWLRFSLHNCSLTWIAIRPSGRVVVYTVGDIGHIPPSKMTTSQCKQEIKKVTNFYILIIGCIVQFCSFKVCRINCIKAFT